MKNNFWTRLWLAIVYLLNYPVKFIGWFVWVLSSEDITPNWNKYKDTLTAKMFIKEDEIKSNGDV